jgi:hypothetical protein
MKTDSQSENEKRFADLLQWHQYHVGLYARVATKAGVTPAYVSLVARGFRRNEKITAALWQELERLAQIVPK